MADIEATLRSWQVAIGYTYESGGSLPPDTPEEVKRLLEGDGGLLKAAAALTDIARMCKNEHNGIIYTSRIENTIRSVMGID